MKQRLYNSKFEIRPRIMLLASMEPGRLFSEDQLIIYDFMAVYAHEFIDGCRNLHGDNGFKYSEFSARKQAVGDAVRALVRNGLHRVELQDGFRYAATDEGTKCFSGMESSYATEYKEQLGRILDAYSDYAEADLHKLIRMKSINEDEGRRDPLCTT